MNKSEISELITEFRYDFVDQNKHPSIDDEDLTEYKLLCERFHRRLGNFTAADVRKMFESYIGNGKVFFPKVPAELLQYKPTVVEDEQNVPDLDQTREYIERIRKEKAEFEERMKDPLQRKGYEDAKRKAQEQFETICRQQGIANRRRNIVFDFTDSESGED